MKKLCILVGFYPINRGGAEYQAYLLAQEIKNQFDIFFISIGHPKEETIEREGYRIYTLKMPRLLSKYPLIFPLAIKINNILESENPAYIYQRMGNATTGIAAHYGKKHDCKVIWHIASQSDLNSPVPTFRELLTLKFVDKLFQSYGIRNVDNIIGQAQYQDELLKKRYKKHCDIIVSNFHPAPTVSPSKSSPIKIVWIANFKKLKQPELFLQLAQHFKDRSDIEFIMVGRKGYSEVEEQIQRYCETENNLKYLGELKPDDVNELLQTAHVLVNTSLYEGFPNTFVQAWMRRVPVVSLNVDPDSILTNVGIGFISRTFEQMVEDIDRLVNDEGLREGMADKAQSYAIETHSLSNISKIRDLIFR